MSQDLQSFLADKWALGEQKPLYDLLSDAALAVVTLPDEKERLGAVGFWAGELVAFWVKAGLSVRELHGLAARLQNELSEAIVREVG